MASRREKRADGAPRETATDYYRLHTDAVDALVGADEDNSPPVPEEELRKYRSGPRLRFADWAKALLVKIWFAGSVCFFIFWGLSAYITAQLDLLLVFGVALGIVTDLLTNNVFRFYAKTPGANDRWMMFPKQRYAAFLGNIVYACWLLACVAGLYRLINLALLAASGARDAVPLGVEPILFGVFYTLFDLLFLAMKRLAGRIISDARERARSSS